MKRAAYMVAAGAALTAIAAATFLAMPTRLIWNASASVPIGFYSLAPIDAPKLGELVATMPPETFADYLVARGYIGRDTPLLKHVAALPGQSVCRSGVRITIDGRFAAEARPRDRQGRDLPTWRGCRRLGPSEIFLMNTAVSDSMDGRYFGPTSIRAVIGRASPLYTDETADGRFIWRASRARAPRLSPFPRQ